MSSDTSCRPARRARPHRLGLFQISCTAVLWGTGGVIVQLLHAHARLSPVSIAFYRLAVGAAVLLGATAHRGSLLRDALRSAPGLLLGTGLGLAGYQALYFVAVTDVGVSVATMLTIGLAPVLLALGEAVHTRRLPTLAAAATVTVASGGLALVTLGGARAPAGPHPLLGLACAIGSGIGYAGTTALSRRATARIAPVPLTTLTTTVGAVALAPLAAVRGLGFAVSPAPVVELLYLGPVTTSVAFALFYLGLRTTATSTAAVLTLVEPIAAAGLATAALGDPLPADTVLGGLLTLGAVASLYLRASAG